MQNVLEAFTKVENSAMLYQLHGVQLWINLISLLHVLLETVNPKRVQLLQLGMPLNISIPRNPERLFRLFMSMVSKSPKGRFMGLWMIRRWLLCFRDMVIMFDLLRIWRILMLISLRLWNGHSVLLRKFKPMHVLGSHK